MSAHLLDVAGRRYRAAGGAIEIAIPLRFDGPQPAHFGAPPAHAEPMRSGAFVGDTRQGGSCNARVYTLNAHCNGTHTECVSHVMDDELAVHSVLRAPLYLAALVTIDPEPASGSGESATHPFGADDRVVSAAALLRASRTVQDAGHQALVVRTTPNGTDKLSRRYEGEAPAPYLTLEAARCLVELGIEHVLVDLPSIDRAHDGGSLGAHRIFWGLPAGSRRLALAARPAATITELVYVPDAAADGLYLLSLQVPAFVADAAPSRPLLYPAIEENA